MAFQQFRLGELSLHPSITPHIPGIFVRLLLPVRSSSFCQLDTGPSHTTFATNPHKSVASSSKQPYGSGDSDDGYTLCFTNLHEFQQWRQDEEERNMVEFVKVRFAPPDGATAHPFSREIPMEARQSPLASRTIPSSSVQGIPAAAGRSM